MITDYDSLKAEIASNVARSDVTASSEAVSTAIQLAEKHISRKLKVTQMEKDQAITLVASQDYTDLNADFRNLKNLEFTSSPKNIEYIPDTKFKTLTIGQGSGRPRAFSIGNNSTTGRQKLVFAATPDDAYTLTLTYYAAIPALSDSNTTNWLIDYDPDLYLDAALYYIYKRLRNPLAGEYKALLVDTISDLNKETQTNKMGPSGTRVRVRGSVV